MASGSSGVNLTARLLPLDEDELFAELGAAELGATLGIRPAEFGRFARIGRRWYDAINHG